MSTTDEELIISGDGKTPKTAINFKPCRLLTRVARERQFVNDQFGKENVDWRKELHYTSTNRQSVWVIELADGAKHKIYFDTSSTIYDEDK
ncbi:MAG: hypothetical protein IPL32_08415 [Chloracidobacterium sp.]|nr:hypothetical protein [Chloracidobacterium sp.]